MPYKIEYNDKDGGVFTTYFGVVTDSDIIASLKERIESKKRVENYRYVISDYSGAEEFKVTTEGIKQNALIAVRASESNRKGVLVAILPRDHEYGMGRMWQAYADDSGWKTYIARDKKEAYDWINENIPEANIKDCLEYNKSPKILE